MLSAKTGPVRVGVGFPILTPALLSSSISRVTDLADTLLAEPG